MAELKNVSVQQRTLILIGMVFVLGLSGLLPLRAEAYTIHSAEVKVFTAHGSQEESFFGFDEKFQGGGRVATGDVNGDGAPEIIVGAGSGGGPNVRVFEPDGTYVASIMAYDEQFRGGVFVAAGDVDGDGTDEIITGAGTRGGPDVRVFSLSGVKRARFLAYDEQFRGGVFVAAGDVDGDGIDEIVTGSGPGGKGHVRVFNGHGQPLGLDFWPFDGREIGGAAVAVGDVGGDAKEEIITSVFSVGRAEVKVYGYDPTRPIFGHFFAFPDSYRGGISVGTANVAGDAHAEILVGPTAGGPHVKAFTVGGSQKGGGFFPYPKGYTGGVFVAGLAHASGFDGIVTIPGNGQTLHQSNLPQLIEVDLSEQRLYAYEYGALVKTFLVSTGIAKYPTPTGTFSVYQKIPVHLYSGPGYYLPNTKWNLRYDGSRLLHGAYWHNNFGRPMSHGCINISYPNAEWLYHWAPLGTTVIVKQ